MARTLPVFIVALILYAAALAGIVYLFILLVRVLRAYLRSQQVCREQADVTRSLGQVLRQHRADCHMTQEFVAEALGVSRQAVSKWESGASDPSTSNLLALAKLFQVPAEELLRQARQ